MYYVSAQGVDERVINVHYYYYSAFSPLMYSCTHSVFSPLVDYTMYTQSVFSELHHVNS